MILHSQSARKPGYPSIWPAEGKWANEMILCSPDHDSPKGFGDSAIANGALMAWQQAVGSLPSRQETLASRGTPRVRSIMQCTHPLLGVLIGCRQARLPFGQGGS